MQKTLLRLLLLALCALVGSSAFAADVSSNKCGTPQASYTFRFLMVYDTRGAAYARSHYTTLEAHAQKGIDKCNEVVRNSNIDAYFELGDVMELTDFTQTDGSSEGMMAAGQSIPERADVRQRWRDGDCHICAFVCSPGNNSLSGNFCLEPLSWDRSCGVMDASALSETYSLIHETGHVFGCHHDRNRDSHDYAVGYLGSTYYTVMSYGHLYQGVQLVPYFSGPDQVYNGVTLGDARTNNARMFREHLAVVDQFSQRSKIVIVKQSEETSTGNVITYLNDNTLNIGYSKKYFNLIVTASDELSIGTGEKWMKLRATRSEGSMDYNVSVDVEDNYGNSPREGRITIQSLTDPSSVHEVIVRQNCPNGVIVSPTEFTITSQAQSLSAHFVAEGSGTLRSDDTWITINGNSAANLSSDCNVTFQIAANTTGKERVGHLRAFRSEQQSVTTITVTQAPDGMGFSDFPTTPLAFDSRRQTQQLAFFAGQAFSISSPAWVTCTKTAETGHVKVNVSVEANSSSATRSGEIRFTTADGKDVRVVSITQTPASSYAIDLTSWTPNCRAQNKLVHLTTATYWQAVIDEDVQGTITVSPTSGTGNATLNIRITENTGSKPRYAKVKIQGDESCTPVTIQIVQEGFDSKAVAPDPEVEEGGGNTGGGEGGGTGTGDKDPDKPVVTNCATPVISLADGTLAITCATAGATLHYALSAAKLTLSGTGTVDLSQLAERSYVLTVYATAEGYNPSGTTSVTLSAAELAALSSLAGDGYGQLGLADIEALVQKVLSNTK